MPPARTATVSGARSRARATAPPPRRIVRLRRLPRRPPVGRVRWDRVGRVALLLVLAVVVALYVQHALAYVSARGQYNRQRAAVQALQRANAQLLQEQSELQDPATIALDARRLGMVRPGERAYVITGLSGQ